LQSQDIIQDLGVNPHYFLVFRCDSRLVILEVHLCHQVALFELQVVHHRQYSSYFGFGLNHFLAPEQEFQEGLARFFLEAVLLIDLVKLV